MSAAERESLLALPDAKDELIRNYTFNDADLAIIRQHRGPTNRLGFAVQLCYLRFPGIVLGVDQTPFPPLLRIVAAQLNSTLSEHLSLFVELLFTIGGIGSGLTFSVTDFHLAEDLRQRRIPPG